MGRIAVEPADGEGALGSFADLERVSAAERVQEILVAPSAGAHPELATTLLWCRARSIDLRLVSDLAGIFGRGARAEDFLGLPAVAYRMEGLYPLQRALKRLVDLLVATVALALTLLPGLLHLAVNRRAERRQLPLAAADGRHPRWPQLLGGAGRPVSDLLNPWAYAAVLAGGLSMVGPMPRPASATGGSPYLLAMRPGLTGAWRQRGRVAAPAEAEQLDLFYLRNWSLGLDLQLWLDTLGVQLRGEQPPFLLERWASGAEAARPAATQPAGGKGTL